MFFGSSPPTKAAERSVIINTEIDFVNTTRTSLPLKLKGYQSKLLAPKTADTVTSFEVFHLRRQLEALPDGLKEDLRFKYMMDQEKKRREQQEFQCLMMGRLERLLLKRIEELGLDYRAFKIGGHERGTYGKYLHAQFQFELYLRYICLTFFRKVFPCGTFAIYVKATIYYLNGQMLRRRWRLFTIL